MKQKQGVKKRPPLPNTALLAFIFVGWSYRAHRASTEPNTTEHS